MLFGYLGAPATFQAIVESILGKISGGVQARVYIDDIHPFGNNIIDVWQDTVKVIKALSEAGFLINLAKCTFLTADLVILGFRLF